MTSAWFTIERSVPTITAMTSVRRSVVGRHATRSASRGVAQTAIPALSGFLLSPIENNGGRSERGPREPERVNVRDGGERTPRERAPGRVSEDVPGATRLPVTEASTHRVEMKSAAVDPRIEHTRRPDIATSRDFPAVERRCRPRPEPNDK